MHQFSRRKFLTLALLAGTALPARAQNGAETTGSLGSAPRRGVPGVDSALLREAVTAAERGDVAGATARAQRLGDPAAQTLVEWFLLRAGSPGIPAQRIQRFMAQYPDWPGDALLRTRAEQAMLTERRPAAEVLAFFRSAQPRSAAGRVVLATALKETGATDRAHALVREVWRLQDVSPAIETAVGERFPNVLGRADHVARMHRAFYKERAADGLRLAQRLGGEHLAVGRARAAVVNRTGNALALLDAVPQGARSDPGYQFSRIQWLRRAERFREAATLLLAAPREQSVLIEPDEWWTERRLVARKLLEENDARTAYRIVAGHSCRRDTERMEAEFHAGWIALRHLRDAATADTHFAKLQADARRPISVSRGAYWRGRAAEAGGGFGASSHYEAAARHRTTFYGQLAMAKLGRGTVQLASPPQPDGATRARFQARGPVKAIRMLAAAGMVERTRPFFAEMADELRDPEEVVLLAQLAGELGQVRYSLLVGKQAMQRGLPLDAYAYPLNGVPNVAAVGPQVERAVVLALSRQESTFDPVIRSSAGAVGLMQLLPSTAQQTARRYNVAWTASRITDPTYNTQLGTAYLGEGIQEFGGSYILAFAAYNAGRSRVREWIGRFGDPRDANVDPIDWVERIPFSETRNYVMRVLENTQVYRARLGAAQLRIEQDLRRRSGNTTTIASE